MRLKLKLFKNFKFFIPRCGCLKKISNDKLRILQREWRQAFYNLELEFAARHYKTFTLLSIPMLQIESRYPEQLFIAEKPLLNR